MQAMYFATNTPQVIRLQPSEAHCPRRLVRLGRSPLKRVTPVQIRSGTLIVCNGLQAHEGEQAAVNREVTGSNPVESALENGEKL